MSMQRIQVSGVGLTATGSDLYYTVPINPIEFENIDNTEVTFVRVVDGWSTEMIPQYDGRPRTFEWRNIPNKSPYTIMVANFRTLKFQEAYLKLRALSGNENDTTETAIRVVNVETKWSDQAVGDGAINNLQYETIKLSYVLR